MNEAEILTGVERAFHAVFGARSVFREDLARASEPKWTSLKHVEFIIALEMEFGVRFDGADATDMTSIAIVRDRLRTRLA